MIDHLTEPPLKKYHSSSYRQQPEPSPSTPPTQTHDDLTPNKYNTNINHLIIPRLNKENINPRSNNKSSKNIITNNQQNHYPPNYYINNQPSFLTQNLTNSCYLNQQHPYSPTRRDITKYQFKYANQFDIIVTQPTTQDHPLTPTLPLKYSSKSKQYKRYSHLVESTPPSYYQYPYQEFQTNKSNAYTTKCNDQTNRSKDPTIANNQYGVQEVGETKVCQTSRASRPPCPRASNSCAVGLKENGKGNGKYLNTTFPYTSSVTYNCNRPAFMSESMGLPKIPERLRCVGSSYESNEMARKYSLSSRSRSRLETLREPQLDDFIIGQCKGQGRFGKVYMAVHRRTGFLCALKKVKKEGVKYMMEQFIQEVKIQLFLNHPKLVKLYGYFCDEEHFYMLIEYMEDGSLYALMKKNKKIEESQTIQKLRQICQGVKEMHDNNIVHRDLKPQNIVMTHGVCKVCDFGWAAICQDRRQTYCGTLDYVCPEIIEGNSYDSGVDVWCIGVLAYELMCGKAPFYDISRKKTMQKIKSCKIQYFPSYLSVEAIKFIQMILTKDPDDRTGIQELLDSDFLKNKQK